MTHYVRTTNNGWSDSILSNPHTNSQEKLNNDARARHTFKSEHENEKKFKTFKEKKLPGQRRTLVI